MRSLSAICGGLGMGGEWKDCSLGDVVELKRGYDLPQKERLPGDVPLVSSSGVTDTHAKAMVKGPGVVTGRYGTLGQVFYVEQDFWPLNTTLYVRDFKGNDPRFISYFLRDVDFLAYSDKAAVPGLNRNHLHQAKVRIPVDPAEQCRIAHILDTLDDKIENNRKTAKTLEAMAQTIFQSWFVDFDPVRAKMAGESRESICKRLKLTPEILDLFPDRLVDSELGEIPEGWEVKPIIKEFDVTMGQSPPGNTYNQIGDGFPFYQGCADFGIKYPGNRIFCTEPTRTARKGDTLISVRAPVGRMNVATEICAIGRGVAAIRHHTESTAYTYNLITSLHDVFDGFNSEGTVFGAIGKSDFHKVRIISPPNIIVTKHDSLCNATDQRQSIFHEEISRLVKIRDHLLPKLISGEIRVSDAQAVVDTTANASKPFHD
ncbi:MAG: restriction endonuclease subunit S [Gammaproteobacteria bacterium]|nr:restriction endonuclease subunit S [Gammaproteobacteria bacterium]